MKTRSICALEHEAKGLIDGSVTTLIRPVKPDLPWDAPNRIGSHELDSGKWGFFDDNGQDYVCPFGPPGTRLAVREAHTFYPIELNPDPCDVWYRADGDTRKPPVECTGVYRWRSPATMPAWAVRTHVTVASVRVVRCGEIGDADAKAWGVWRGDGQWHHGPDGVYQEDEYGWYVDHVRHNAPTHALRQRWDRLYGKRHPFASSWAWVVGVER